MTTKTIDQLPVYSGDLSAAYTLVRVADVTYKVPATAMAAAGGGSSLAGYPVSASGAQTGDVLSFNSGTWVNETRTLLTDGGNF